jgi:hypothetical protein
MAVLKIRNTECQSLFRTFGKKEDTLTKALGYIISTNSQIALEILKAIGFKYLRNVKNFHSSDDFIITLQRQRDEGITDIEINYNNKFHCIIEAKISNKFPSDDQILRYISELNNSTAQMKIFAVLNDDSDNSNQKLLSFKNKYNDKINTIVLQAIGWNIILNILNKFKYDDNNYLINELITFMEKDFNMSNYYDDEVWVCPVTTKEKIPNTNFTFMDFALKKNIYFHLANRRRRKCIYFAPKYNSKIEYIFKINSVEEGFLKDIIEGSNDTRPHKIFRLGKPIKLPKIVKYSGQNNTYCSIEDLLTKEKLEKSLNMKEL